jgi:hypothetical protein
MFYVVCYWPHCSPYDLIPQEMVRKEYGKILTKHPRETSFNSPSHFTTVAVTYLFFPSMCSDIFTTWITLFYLLHLINLFYLLHLITLVYLLHLITLFYLLHLNTFMSYIWFSHVVPKDIIFGDLFLFCQSQPFEKYYTVTIFENLIIIIIKWSECIL